MSASRRSSSRCDRFVWPGLALLPVVVANGFRDLGGSDGGARVRSRCSADCRSRCLAYLGYVFVPLGHGAVIQPSCAALGGMHPGAAGVEGAAAGRGASPAGSRSLRPLPHRQRSVAHHRRARRRRRSPVRGWRDVLCHLRHAGAAVAGTGDAVGGDHQRAVARRTAGPAVQFDNLLACEICSKT